MDQACGTANLQSPRTDSEDSAMDSEAGEDNCSAVDVESLDTGVDLEVDGEGEEEGEDGKEARDLVTGQAGDTGRPGKQEVHDGSHGQRAHSHSLPHGNFDIQSSPLCLPVCLVVCLS